MEGTSLPPVTNDTYKLVVDVASFISLSVISLLIIMMNTFTIIAIVSTSKLRNVTGYLMISLATADLGVGVMTAFPLVYAIVDDHLTAPACDMIGFLSSVCWVVSVYTLMLLSVDRLVAIIRPLSYQMVVTTKRCLITICLTWLLSCMLWTLPLVGVGSYKYNDEEVTCYFDVAGFPAQWIIYMAVIFIPSSTVMAISYSCMWFVAKKQKVWPQDGAQNSEALNTTKKNLKALRTLIIIIGAFYIAWLPFIIEHITKASSGKLKHIPEWLEITIYMLAVTNSFWNPIIYAATNRIFRLANLKLLLRICPSCICLKTNNGDRNSTQME